MDADVAPVEAEHASGHRQADLENADAVEAAAAEGGSSH